MLSLREKEAAVQGQHARSVVARVVSNGYIPDATCMLDAEEERGYAYASSNRSI